MKSILFAAALATVGCGLKDLPLDRASLVDGPAGWETARLAICEDFEVSGCPDVYWNGPDGLNCNQGQGFLDDTGACRGGVQGANGILLALPDPNVRPSDTPIAHELAHQKWDDPGHSNLVVWGPDGGSWDSQRNVGSRVGDENAALIAAGL